MENFWLRLLIYLSERSQISRYQIYRLFEQYGKIAGLPVKLHPHMLRHACGYALADLGRDTRLIQDYLGHRNIAHTVIYTASNENALVVFGLIKRRLNERCQHETKAQYYKMN